MDSLTAAQICHIPVRRQSIRHQGRTLLPHQTFSNCDLRIHPHTETTSLNLLVSTVAAKFHIREAIHNEFSRVSTSICRLPNYKAPEIPRAPPAGLLSLSVENGTEVSLQPAQLELDPQPPLAAKKDLFRPLSAVCRQQALSARQPRWNMNVNAAQSTQVKCTGSQRRTHTARAQAVGWAQQICSPKSEKKQNRLETSSTTALPTHKLQSWQPEPKQQQFQCEYCSMQFWTFARAVDHEEHCKISFEADASELIDQREDFNLKDSTSEALESSTADTWTNHSSPSSPQKPVQCIPHVVSPRKPVQCIPHVVSPRKSAQSTSQVRRRRLRTQDSLQLVAQKRQELFMLQATIKRTGRSGCEQQLQRLKDELVAADEAAQEITEAEIKRRQSGLDTVTPKAATLRETPDLKQKQMDWLHRSACGDKEADSDANLDQNTFKFCLQASDPLLETCLQTEFKGYLSAPPSPTV